MIDLRSKLILKNREGSYQVSIMTFSVITIDSGEELNDHSKGIHVILWLPTILLVIPGGPFNPTKRVSPNGFVSNQPKLCRKRGQQ